MTDTLTPYTHFISTVYAIEKPQFLDNVRKVSMAYLKNRKEADLDPMFPVQTSGFYHEPEMTEFNDFILGSATAILTNQGYDMTDKIALIQEMWCQEHNQYQGHNEHIHSDGNQISGFYFLDAPESGCKVALHDPRQGRRQIAMKERDLNVITEASETVLYIPKPGTMYFINSWLPHSITRNPGTEPTRLVHFNIIIQNDLRPKAPKKTTVVL